MGIKVCKFGGSSLADAAHFQRVRDILLGRPAAKVRGCERARQAR